MVGARLVNDDDPTCRKLCAKCIKELIERLSYNRRSKLFDIIITWLKDIKVLFIKLNFKNEYIHIYFIIIII